MFDNEVGQQEIGVAFFMPLAISFNPAVSIYPGGARQRLAVAEWLRSTEPPPFNC